MPTFPFQQGDAFTDRPLGGNPCAIFFETDEMSEETMQALAREMNLSESVFVRRSEVADFGVRYFTPAEEIPLAGHPTIATTYALIDTGRLALTGRETTLTLELKVGPIKVEVLADDAGRVQSIVMTQKKPTFLATYDPADIQAVFGLSSTDLLSDLPIQTDILIQ
jgi:trans-2,3-dihydro-3-hydroxyanthranilate isomerase